jgi:hypothetical protein
MTKQRFSNWRKLAIGGAAALLLPALAVSTAQGQTRDPVSELIRKAQAREQDNGFCAGITDWPAGTRETYVYFLNVAAVGFGKVNRFQSNTHCQFDRVTAVFTNASGAKCVSYTWFACATGKGCGLGQDTECQKNGDWERQ